MDYKTALKYLIGRIAFMVVYALFVLFLVSAIGGPMSGIGMLVPALMGFAGMFIGITLFGRSIGDFIAASANRLNQ